MRNQPRSVHLEKSRQFASDNYSGICPEAWAALQEANEGPHMPSYGNDPWTQRASDMIRETFETNCEVFFVFNGTAANSLALASMCQSYHSILCSQTAHIETDECGAPQFFSNGTKILLIAGENGKLTPAAIEERVLHRTDIHYPKPKVVSLTQSTELGTLYSVDELKAIGAMARKHGMNVHMDGARFANAVVAMNVKPREITWEAGVDVLCFGTAKNGSAVGEAVVFFNKDLAYEFDFRAKQAGQLASKMRFLSAPLAGMLEGGAWLRHAAHANAMTALLEKEISGLPNLTPLFKRHVNALFVEIPAAAIDELHARGWMFYNFIGEGGCRLMCSWDTREEDVLAFAADIREVLSQ